MEQTDTVVTVFAGGKGNGQRQGKNTCQPGLRPDASVAHPGRYASQKYNEVIGCSQQS